MRTAPILSAIAILASPAVAGPLNPDHVPAHAAWVVHLDVEAAVGSRVGGFVLEHAEAFDIAQGLEDFRNETGLDAVHDLYGITLFGEPHDEWNAVAVLETSVAVDAFLEQANDEVELDGVTMHVLDTGDQVVYLHVAGAPRDRRIVTMSAQKTLVVAAAKVQHGEATSMAEAGHDDSVPGRGSILFAIGRGLPWVRPEDDAVAAVLRRTNRVRFNLGEIDDMSSVALVVSAPSIEDATNVSMVLQGGLALGRLASAHTPDLRELGQLLSTISLSAERNDVVARIEAPSEMVVAILGALAGVQ